MSLDSLKDAMPEYAKDIKLNLSSIFAEGGAPGLTLSQVLGSALATAYATKNSALIQHLQEYAEMQKFPAENIQAAKAAATIMAMNNVYYRTLHLISDKSYNQMPAKLRMNIIGAPGIEKLDFEMYSLAVSVLNGCGYCVDAHANKLQADGVTKEGIQSIFRIAAIMNAADQALFLASVD